MARHGNKQNQQSLPDAHERKAAVLVLIVLSLLLITTI